MSFARCIRALTVTAALVAAVAPPSACFAGPAPPISSVIPYAVCSQHSQAWSYIHPNQYSTQWEGGSWVCVVTQEIGYGQPIAATINGYPGTQLTQLNQAIVQNGIITGWYRYWYFQGNNLNGEFIYTVRSLNGSATPHTAWIYIE
jgi:hypothetical protein